MCDYSFSKEQWIMGVISLLGKNKTLISLTFCSEKRQVCSQQIDEFDTVKRVIESGAQIHAPFKHLF